MSIDKDTVAKVSNLARIKIDKDQLNTISNELESVIEWIDTLSEVNTDGVEPVANVSGQKLPLREDIVTDGGYSEKILRNAPEKESSFFVVPKVVE
jgi:aspartyl-tRNA(Asn)/glutamyl-tRNA(Gln) amidotransferase subunit C|tara:strand:+ start:65 stop:352 length:288 start_codon:yes stop_codon:yes gene_type:complete